MSTPHPATEFFKEALAAGRTPDEAYAKTVLIFGPVDAKAAREGVNEIVRRFYNLRIPPILADNEYGEWYLGPSVDDPYWGALIRYLQSKPKPGWDESKVGDLDRDSSQVIARIAPPGQAKIRSRGLVVGYVQSGKTANFTAVIAKAADVRYRLFVVLSGLTNALRSQTQERLERELVTQYPGGWLTLTNNENDFSGRRVTVRADAVLNPASGNRVLAVIKKNAVRLRRFVEWLESSHPENRSHCAILVIDDEADQASINTSKNAVERSKINRLIVRLLNSMPKAAYIGYTATPFANVLNEPPGDDSLYPRSFIVSLPERDGYFGPAKVFGRDRLKSDEEDADIDGLDIIRTISVEEGIALRTMGAAGEAEIPASLDLCLRYFLMATAARYARDGSVDFSTLMVHTTQRVIGHSAMRKALEAHCVTLSLRIAAGDKRLLEELRAQWTAETARVAPEEAGCAFPAVTFDALLPHLDKVAVVAEFVVDNYRSPARLDFSTPGKVFIVIGGNTLARGLTVEGLVTSYFIRTSSAYDTLLQMGRWFGYRPGYEDLQRIWMTDELQGYFYDLATVEEEFRAEVRRYTLGMTPAEFGPKIRTHPDLEITSRLKMQSAIDVDVSYGGHRCQTILFYHRDPSWLERNLKAATALIAAAKKYSCRIDGPTEGHLRAFDVPVELILQFFEGYQLHSQSRELKKKELLGYITAQNKEGSLKQWNVVVVGLPSDKLGAWETGAGPVGLIKRSRLVATEADRGVTANIKSLMSMADIVADLDARPDKADYETLQEHRNTVLPNHGLLLLYPISKLSVPALKKNGEPNLKREPLDAVLDVMGVAMVFPKPKHDTPQSYRTIDMSGVAIEEPEYDENEDEEDKSQ